MSDISFQSQLRQMFTSKFLNEEPVFRGRFEGQHHFVDTTLGTRNKINCFGDQDFRLLADELEAEVEALENRWEKVIWKGIHDYRIYMDNDCFLNRETFAFGDRILFRFYGIEIVMPQSPIERDVVCNLYLERA